MDLRYYSDATERQIRIDLEELIMEADEYSTLANKAEEESVQNAYRALARDRKLKAKNLVKGLYEKNHNNTLYDSFTYELAQFLKRTTEENVIENKRYAHLKNIIRKGRYLYQKKPTTVALKEFTM